MRRLTLGQLFGLATLAVAIVVTVGFGVFLHGSHESIIDASDKERASAARRIDARVSQELARAEQALFGIDQGVRSGAIAADDRLAIEAAAFLRLADDEHLAEITFTHATRTGFDDRGEGKIADDGKWQVSVYRTPEGHLETRVTTPAEGGFVSETRARTDDSFALTPLVSSGKALDPTAHATFTSLATKDAEGHAAWSDLHRSELDRLLPEAQRRVVISVQAPLEDHAKHFVGVLRVGLLTKELDAIAKLRVDETDPNDPHRIALFAVTGPKHEARLVARVDPADKVELVGDDLRIVPEHPTPELAALLSSPLVQSLDPAHPNAGGILDVDGERWLATLHELKDAGDGTAGWFVAVLVPEAHYTRTLVGYERLFAIAFALTLALVIAIGVFTVMLIRRGLATLFATTTKMNDFDFSATAPNAPFRDLEDVMSGLERAKTVVRTMEKYIPVDLVRRLYADNREPELGGDLLHVSMLFTDIEGFTTLSEQLPPAILAKRLGDYLDAMTSAITASGGIIDKYIGDAVMALWNAPTEVPAHPKAACRAVLACMKATAALYESPIWKGLPALTTRYGLHEARVMVGHFGATARLSYTALGDGVNLAARLEPLCKQYGVVCLVSEDIVKDARDAFVFRRVDRVAVKGKTNGIEVFELLGAIGEEIDRLVFVKPYEAAFEAYLQRDFAKAIALVEPQAASDPPSEVLLDRCRAMLKNPPADGWDGVHVAVSK